MDKPPQTWPPSAGDCSQGYCSYYCPQWCFFFFPPPPPPPPPSSHRLLSPLLISVITVTSTAFVLVAYYLILTRYRARQRNRSSGPTLPPQNPASGFLTLGNGGLDDNLINKIRMYRYRKGGGSPLVLDGMDCSVCLGPFEDGDKIRLLPKCSHAFHQCCIDTWLKSHSNCPLCRACILLDLHEGRPESGPSESDAARVVRIEEINREVIEIGEGRRLIGRSFSMDSPFWRHEVDTDADADTDTHINSRGWSRSLHSVMSPIRMKRSRSTRSVTGRGRSAILPT